MLLIITFTVITMCHVPALAWCNMVTLTRSHICCDHIVDTKCQLTILAILGEEIGGVKRSGAANEHSLNGSPLYFL